LKKILELARIKILRLSNFADVTGGRSDLALLVSVAVVNAHKNS